MRHTPQSCMTVFMSGRMLRYAKGDVVIRADDVPPGVYYIASGWIQVASICHDGEPNILYTLYEGDIFPFTWAVTDRLQSTTFSAMSTTTVYRVSKESFQEAMLHTPEFSRNIVTNLASQHQRLSDQQDNLHFRSASQRVAYRILRLADQFGRLSERGIFIKHSITNEYIARSSNMTRETASREMTKLAQKDIITVHRGHIFIADIQALEQETVYSRSKRLQLLS